MRSRDQNLQWNRLSQWWPQEGGGSHFGIDQNVWMCAEDLGTSIWWHFQDVGVKESHDLPAILLRESSARLRELLAESIPREGYRSSFHQLAEDIGDFSKSIAQEWMYGNEAVFEVCAGWRFRINCGIPEEIRLLRLPRESLRIKGQKMYQEVPIGVKKDFPGGLVELDNKRIIRFSPPASLRITLARARDQLQVIGALDSMARGDMTSFSKYGETFTEVMRDFSVQRARATRHLGWDGRGLFGDHMTAHHQTLRRFQWERFCIRVRNAIMSHVRNAFTIIGSWCLENPRLLLCNFWTEETINAMELRFINGNLTMDDVFEELSPLRMRHRNRIER